jgi:hypothetical protein
MQGEAIDARTPPFDGENPERDYSFEYFWYMLKRLP